jgi:DNA-directed RNA polymerase subunit RPC12/RpoP
MPIRFRCAYCNQLMGIARRKAGQAVRCPTCSGQVIVPKVDEEPEEAPAAPERDGGAALFEKSDFDKELFDSRPSVQVGSARPGGFASVPPVVAAPPAPPLAPAQIPPLAPQGILLTPGKATVLAVLFVLLLGAAFFAGMLAGRS